MNLLSPTYLDEVARPVLGQPWGAPLDGEVGEGGRDKDGLAIGTHEAQDLRHLESGKGE
jgi:hypothetical protein